MDCPYCNNEMSKGQIEGDGRMPFAWIDDEEKNGILGKIFMNEKYVIADKHPFSRTRIKGYK